MVPHFRDRETEVKGRDEESKTLVRVRNQVNKCLESTLPQY